AGDSFNVHPEALIFIDEVAFTAVDVRHTRLTLPEHGRDGALHTLRLEGWTGLGGSLWGDDRQRLYMQSAALVLVDEVARDLVALARTTLEAIRFLPPAALLTTRLLALLRQALHAVDTRHPIGADFYASLPGALALLRDGLNALGEPLPVTITAAGHAHIDTAWLWTLDETRGKARRTFHTALHLLDEFPRYHFAQSQPQLYEFVRQADPALFRRIQTAVQQGRWEPLGAMWVEADCNLSGAESLARQFLIGRSYLQQHFGADHESAVLWLPDTFGYPATLPLIAREAGIRYFFTTKLRWNEINDFPYDSFWWQGPDGTRLLTHITPTPMPAWLRIATYNAEAGAQATLETWERLKQKDPHPMALMAYGWGDGGGGPDRTMLENLAALDDFPGLPRTVPGRVRDFFHALEHTAGPHLPVWQGELYLETHQGTFTSQARIKRANRQAEVALHAAEYLATWATLFNPAYVYEHATLNALWRTVLLHQFHDILPGSSIAAVYAQARPEYARVLARLAELSAAALAALDEGTAGWRIINTTSFERPATFTLPVALPAGSTLAAGGTAALAQPVDGGTLISLAQPLPPFGVMVMQPAPAPAAVARPSALRAEPTRLENDWLLARFNAAGDLISLVDKRSGWQVIGPDAVANQFQIFEDRPLRFDAWNIDPDYEERRWTAEPAHRVAVVEDGPIRATLLVQRRIQHSTITQHISLYHDRAELDFRTHIDWQERHMLLKVAFPVQLQVPQATYHIQWGSVQRPTHRSTAWDAARYEVALHYFADLGEAGRGVTLANDSKYGGDIHENVMRLTLLKSATYPDPLADAGEQQFTYRLHVRRGPLRQAFATGYDLNVPLIVQPGGAGHPPAPFTVSEDVIVETIKRSEDGRALILRLYEPAGEHTVAALTCARRIAAAWRSDIMETPHEPLPVQDGHRVPVSLRAHQLLTLRLELEPQP
ncbi:MAG: glycosyl hydrolase-related protein, partial [Anaerolineae bacterium]|nr:glycosyl hydrolase-related protein [Anaerolineae bacterium]